jgi:hypothetical protein
VGQFEILRGFCPLLPFCTVISKIFIGFFEHLVVACATFNKRHNFSPVTKLHPQVEGQVFAVDVFENLLGFIVASEEAGNIRFLFYFLVIVLQTLNQLKPVVVFVFYKSSFGNAEVQLFKSCLSNDFPKALVGVLFNEFDGFFETDCC